MSIFFVDPPIEEMGSRSSLARDVRDDTTGFDHWEMNYHEAAIFLEVFSSIRYCRMLQKLFLGRREQRKVRFASKASFSPTRLSSCSQLVVLRLGLGFFFTPSISGSGGKTFDR